MTQINPASNPLSPAQHVLLRGLRHILAPIARLLLRQRIPFGTFVEVAKQAVVEVAHNEHNLPRRRSTMSRVAMLTGLTRNDVQRILASSQSDSAKTGHYLRPMQIVEAWRQDPRYQDATGAPQTLPVQAEHDQPSFQDLVGRYGADLPPKTVLEELVQAGTVNWTDESYVRLVQRAYVPPSPGSPQNIHMVMRAAEHLLRTGVHNIDESTTDPFFQREYHSDAIPPEQLDALRRDLRNVLDHHFQNAGEHIERHEEPPAIEYYHKTAGIGMYYFED